MSDLVKRLCHPGYDLQKEQAIQEAIIEIRELRAKVETAENDTVHQKALAASALRVAEGWERKCGELRAKIEAMEKQEPVAKVRVHRTGGNAGIAWSVAPLNDFDSLPLMRDGDRLYALPGAQAQPAENAVAYLDLGTGGYMDVGTDLTDEELAALPKGRHMLGIIGTYGVDGYVPTQPAPSVPEGWIQRGIAELEAIRNRLDDDPCSTTER